jgi:hypothetical protein
MHLKGSPLQSFTMQQTKTNNKITKQKQAGGYEIPDPLTRLVFHQPFAGHSAGAFLFFTRLHFHARC